MGLFDNIQRHAAVASGNFAAMFRDVEIPPMTEAATCLITEVNRPEPDVDKLAKLISSTTDIAARVLKTVNSSLYGLRQPVTSVKRAITLIGLDQIRSIALAYTAMGVLPKPKNSLFDSQAFWNDSLLRALFSRALAAKTGRGQPEEAFTASLLADIALPVLLSSWATYYEPVLDEWKGSPLRLSGIERKQFNWDHAQAGAWILHSWKFPEEIVCYVGMHNVSWKEIREYRLENTAVAPVALAAISSSVLKPNPARAKFVFKSAVERMSISASDFNECVESSRTSFHEMHETLGIPLSNADAVFNNLHAAAESDFAEVQ